jgi:hypothetical protein
MKKTENTLDINSIIDDNNTMTTTTTTTNNNAMNTTDINACLDYLVNNYSLAHLLDMAATDDGAYTLSDDGIDFDVECIEAALTIIDNNNL